MKTSEILESLTEQLSRVLPMATEMRSDAEAKIHEVLKKRLDDLQILTAEEFDSQVAVLRRAEQRITELERRLSALENA